MHDRTIRWEVAALPLVALLAWAAFAAGAGNSVLATAFAMAVILWFLAGLAGPSTGR